jgi:adenosylcobinamide-GDP ribazoletransferase
MEKPDKPDDLWKIAGYVLKLAKDALESGFLRKLGRSFVSVWLLVTRIPLPARWVKSSSLPTAGEISVIPAVGAVFCVLVTLPPWLLSFAAPISAASWIACGLYTLFGWSLHLDGWGDLWDGLGSGRRGEAMMTVMKDSRVGSFAVAGIVIAIAARASLLAEIDPSMWLPAAAVSGGAARFALNVAAYAGEYPWKSGMGRETVKNFGGYQLFCAFLLTCVLFPLAPRAWMVGVPLVSLVSFGLAVWANKNLGGTNGDVLGASAVLGELIVLLSCATFE